MKSHAKVVVIGGGAMGAGLLYHLVKEGWTDSVLVEKGELTSGSTWHAAGLVGHFIGNLNMAKIHLYGADLYQTLEAETGQATGWHGCGSIRLATNADEVDWFRQMKGLLDYVGAECHLIGPNEIRQIHPLLDMDGVRLGAYTPKDGHTDPASSTNAMAAGARQGGAEIYRHTRVTDTRRRPGGEWEVVTDKGSIVCEHVVNASGSFAPQVARWVGLEVPIVNMIHQYLVTENLDAVRELDREPPVVRDPRASCYYRQEQDGILVGPYEMEDAAAWGLDGIDWSFDMELPAAGHRSPRHLARMGGEAHPALRERGHQAHRERPHHPLPGRQFPARPGPRPAQLLDVLRGEHRHHPGSGGRQVPRPVDGARPDRDQHAGLRSPALRRLVGRPLHARQVDRRVPADVPGPLSGRVPRGGAPGEDHPDPREARAAGRGVLRDLRLGAAEVVRPARRRGALRLPAYQLVRARRPANAGRCASGSGCWTSRRSRSTT